MASEGSVACEYFSSGRLMSPVGTTEVSRDIVDDTLIGETGIACYLLPPGCEDEVMLQVG